MTKKLYRDKHEGMLAGVAAGLSDYFGVDPSFWRLGILILIIVTGGLFIFVYVAAWIIVPIKAGDTPIREAEYTVSKK